jgi:hypothetical protein
MRLFPRHPDKPRQGRRDQHHFHHRRLVGIPGERKQQPHALAGDKRKRVRRINRLRRDHRDNVFEEIGPEPGSVGVPVWINSRQRNTIIGEKCAQIAPDLLLALFQRRISLADRHQLLRRGPSIDRHFFDLAPGLPGQTRDPDRHEFVEVAARNRQKAQPLEQRIFLILGFGKHALIEGQPAQFAVEEQCLSRSRDAVYGLKRCFTRLRPRSYPRSRHNRPLQAAVWLKRHGAGLLQFCDATTTRARRIT